MIYRWSMPYGKDEDGILKVGILELPERFVSEVEWERIMKFMNLFSEALIEQLSPLPAHESQPQNEPKSTEVK